MCSVCWALASKEKTPHGAKTQAHSQQRVGGGKDREGEGTKGRGVQKGEDPQEGIVCLDLLACCAEKAP